MIWDTRPHISIDPEEAQLNEGGANAWDNCGAADYLWIFKQLGFGDPFEPQQVMDMIHGVGYHGGEVSSRLIAFFKAHVPKCPDIVVEGAPDIVNRLREIGGKMLTTNWWWSNSNGDIQARNTGILHWCTAIYDTGSALGIRNTMRGQVVELPYAQARAAYAGEFTTFHQPLAGGFDVIHESVFWATFRQAQLIAVTQPPDNAMISKYVAMVSPDGSNLDATLQKMISSEPFFADYRRRLASALGEVDQLKTDVAALKKGGAIPPGTQFNATVK